MILFSVQIHLHLSFQQKSVLSYFTNTFCLTSTITNLSNKQNSLIDKTFNSSLIGNKTRVHVKGRLNLETIFGWFLSESKEEKIFLTDITRLTNYNYAQRNAHVLKIRIDSERFVEHLTPYNRVVIDQVCLLLQLEYARQIFVHSIRN